VAPRHGQIIALVLASLEVIVRFLALGASPIRSVTVHGDEFH
jgi:hypothetical protein